MRVFGVGSGVPHPCRNLSLSRLRVPLMDLAASRVQDTRLYSRMPVTIIITISSGAVILMNRQQSAALSARPQGVTAIAVVTAAIAIEITVTTAITATTTTIVIITVVVEEESIEENIGTLIEILIEISTTTIIVITIIAIIATTIVITATTVTTAIGGRLPQEFLIRAGVCHVA